MPEQRQNIKKDNSARTPNQPTPLAICANFTTVLCATVCALGLERQYPLMREFLLLFLLSEAVSPCRLLFLRIKSGAPKDAAAGNDELFNWLGGRKHRKLLVARAFFLLVLALLLLQRPDFFKANLMMLIGIVILLVLLAMRAGDILQKMRTADRLQKIPAADTFPKMPTADTLPKIPAADTLPKMPTADTLQKRNVRMKARTKIALAVAAFLLYLILGVLISGFPQPKISDAYKENFRAEAFYGRKNGDAKNEGTAAGTDRAVILEDNSEALIERVRMIRNAKERIILSTFDFRTDISGKVLLAALLDAAERNVSVKVVVDGVSGLLRMEQNPYFFALSSHPNAEIRIYNRINPLLPWRLMGRLHDKYLIADETAYILGGRNSFSYFLGDWPGHKNYDRDVLVYNAGMDATSSLYQVEAYFNEIWNLKYTGVFHNSTGTGQRTCVKRAAEELKELYAQYLANYPEAAHPADYAAMTFPTGKITLLANPTTVYAKEPTVFYALTELMKQAKSSVTIHTPYIIANDLMYDAFAEIAAAVPDARMMTNSVANNGNPFGAGDYRANFDKIHATGIGLLEYEGGVSYHGKSIVIDDDLSIVGSFNMDMRSVYLDTELMLVIDSEEVNAQLRGLLARYEDECAVVQKDGSRVFPVGVTPQEVSAKKEFNMKVLYNLLRWARRLL